MLVVLEGLDGAGKSTQVALLREYLDLKIAHAKAIIGFASRSEADEGRQATDRFSGILEQLLEMRKNA